MGAIVAATETVPAADPRFAAQFVEGFGNALETGAVIALGDAPPRSASGAPGPRRRHTTWHALAELGHCPPPKRCPFALQIRYATTSCS